MNTNVFDRHDGPGHEFPFRPRMHVNDGHDEWSQSLLRPVRGWAYFERTLSTGGVPARRDNPWKR